MTARLSCRWVHELPWMSTALAATKKPPDGANNLLTPRGLFFESELYEALNASWSDFNTTDNPLSNATVYGNDNTVGASVNAQVIQMAPLVWAEAPRRPFPARNAGPAQGIK